ncbi:MAG: bifunctional UDP-N-acetylglucosamine diphosphorylase/glucosamine-1-phosphate N-acetyltransferase GlmU [Candidatus Desulfofervidaceae bacterium]|nr:bifunctional UDP-N-acetylglucosamine diphosphorylase/glucosamine-1-phosphate N-acetyltransferase GlmU [Candidatus Desulfofervidaceae bacterium]
MEKFLPVVLAAGKGTRMKSRWPKVLHPLLGKPLLTYVLEALRHLSFPEIGVVIGYKAEEIQEIIKGSDIKFILQTEQLGTGHALLCATSFWERAENVLVLNGDVPLLESSTLQELMDVHQEQKAAISFLTAKAEDPTQYGIVLRNVQGQVVGIQEVTERSGRDSSSQEINAGIYCFKTSFLKKYLSFLQPNPKKGEYYITDLISIAAKNQEKIATREAPFPEIIGINNRLELAKAAQILQQRILDRHMLQGVSIIDPSCTYIESDVEIDNDTVLAPGVYLQGRTKIGRECYIGSGTVVKDSKIGNEVEIKPYCVITESVIEDKATIGPFAHLRPGTYIATNARIGNFVEVKKSYVGKGSKASHLTYLGDAEIGKDVNIGAGTITCNYDGKRKHKTVIEDNAFIGSNTALVAPVKVGKAALVGAGSVITEDVPPDTLAIARARQVHKMKKRE